MSNKYKSRKNAKEESDAYVMHLMTALKEVDTKVADVQISIPALEASMGIETAAREASNAASASTKGIAMALIESASGLAVEKILKGSALYKDIKKAVCRSVSGYESERKARDAGNEKAWSRISKAFDRLDWQEAVPETVPDYVTVARCALSADIREAVAVVCAMHKVTAENLVDWLIKEASGDALTPDLESRLQADLAVATTAKDTEAIERANVAIESAKAELQSTSDLYAMANAGLQKAKSSPVADQKAA